MQLVIDIPEEEYALCKKQWDTECLDTLMIAVKYGTPLQKVKDRIDQKQYDFMADGDYNEGVRFGLMLAYQIIDKYKVK